MIFNTPDTVRDINTAELSYSPLFSSFGLVSGPDFPGIGTLCLHYNRKSRPIWDNFIVFGGNMKRTASQADRLVFEGCGKAEIAFYDADSFVVYYEGKEKICVCGKAAAQTTSLWTVSSSPSKLILRGYSKNGDDRDPDKTVAFLAGIHVLRGSLSVCGEGAEITPDAGGKAVFAFSAQALDISETELEKKLEKAPETASAAAEKTNSWITECLKDFHPSGKSADENALLEKAVSGLLFNLTHGQGRLRGYVSAYPNRGKYPTHFMWDSCFQNLALELFNTDIAADSMLLFAADQRTDGKYEQFLCSTWGRPHDSQPALTGWATLRLAKITGDKDFIKTMLSSLERNNDWWLSQRMTRFGVIYCPSGLETGQDDSPRFDGGAVLAVDMNGYLLNQMRSTAELARMLSLSETAEKWDKQADILSENIIKVLYDPEKNLFFDASPETGEKVYLITSSCFLPLWAGVSIEREKAEAMIRSYLLDEKRLFGKIPFPSVAYDQPCYDPQKWWRGPTWMSIAWIMLETLEKYGFEREYREAAKKLYDMMLNDGMLHELFDSQTGKGIGSADQGWTAATFIRLWGMV